MYSFNRISSLMGVIMSQVVRTTNELIVNSLYLLGELGVGEAPDAFMLSTGLELLNEILDKCSADSIFIPYLTTLDFVMVPGQAEYSISDLLGVTPDISGDRIANLVSVNYSVQTVNYPVSILSKSQYYGVVRLTDLTARPGFVFLNKQPLESIIKFYPAPDQPYNCQVQAKSFLDKLLAHQNLNSLPPNCYGFLKYALARKFRSYYPSGNWNETAEDEYQDYYNILKNENELDLTIRPSVLLNSPEPFYWSNILAY